MYCSQCGAVLPSGAKFCSSCGATVTSQPAQAAATQASTGTVPTASSISWNEPIQQSWSQAPPPIHAHDQTFEYAGFLRRWGAIIIDGFIVSIGSFVVGFGFAILLAIGGGLETEGDTDSLSGLYWLMWLIAQWLYYAFTESSPWQATLGKRAVGIIVTDEAGQRLTFGRATGRYWAKFFSYITLLIGFAMAGFTPKKQALHDMVANTLVIVGKRT